jgi:co-chaperonin GroES (HSP10)
MKKKLLVLVALLVLAVGVLTACGGGEPTKDEVNAAYKEAGYGVIATGTDDAWILTATKISLTSGVDTVIITKYSTTGAADDAEKALKDGNKEYLRKGNVIAVGVGNALDPFKNA